MEVGDMADLKWHERPVRMMRLDYLGEMDRMKNCDLDALARSKRDDWHINCEWVMGTLGSAPGLAYQTTFDTPKFEKAANLGDFDIIREYLPYARKYGLSVLAYVNMHWYSFDFAAKHPGWEQLLADGTSYGSKHPLYGSGTTLCVNGGWRDWSMEMIRETMKTGIDGVFLDGPVIFAGCCYCDSCREKFAAKYGADLPTVEDWSDDNWLNFVQFRSDSLAEYLRDSREAARSINPDAVTFLNAGTWHANTWRYARCVDAVSDFEDFNGAEEFFHPGHSNFLLAWAATAKYMAAAGKPSVVFSHHTLGAWHYIPLPNYEAQLAIAQTVACGSNPWFAVFDYALDHSREAAVKPIKEMQSFLASHEEYYTQTESCAQVALLNSSQTATYYVSDKGQFYGEAGSGLEVNLGVDAGGEKRTVDWKARKGTCEGTVNQSYTGYFTALTRAHIPFDVILDGQLSAEGLAGYKTLILPNSACLSNIQIENIKAFVRGGGSVIAEFETGAYDEMGRRRESNPLLEALGVKNTGEMMTPRTAEEYVKVKSQHPVVAGFNVGEFLPRPIYSLECEAAAGAEVASVFMGVINGSYMPLSDETTLPALIANSYGDGRALYVPSLIGDFYGRLKMPQYQSLIENAVRWVHSDPMPIEVEAPATVQVELRRSADKSQLLVHIVNNTGDMQRPISEIIPIRDIKISLPGKDLQRVRALRAGLDLAVDKIDGVCTFTVPEVDVYELVAVDLSDDVG
jgi:type 1 glutamine amidotransferase